MWGNASRTSAPTPALTWLTWIQLLNLSQQLRGTCCLRSWNMLEGVGWAKQSPRGSCWMTGSSNIKRVESPTDHWSPLTDCWQALLWSAFYPSLWQAQRPAFSCPAGIIHTIESTFSFHSFPLGTLTLDWGVTSMPQSVSLESPQFEKLVWPSSSSMEHFQVPGSQW